MTTAPAVARDADHRTYHLPEQSLADALRAVAVQTGRNVVAPADLVEAKRAPALDGDFSIKAAVSALLAGTGLRAKSVAGGVVIQRVDRSPPGALPNDEAASDIVVTGSRIRGAPVASTVITLGRDSIRSAGQANLADVARTLPQSFGGGQNPGIGFDVPEANGADVGGGSSINLRGLGSDATLTLLDGHRLSYSAAKQSVDISAIPFGAVDRIEIVPDGASALFGSDAVAGVVNVILRHDFDGLETGARVGAATDGGLFQQQYDATAGKQWESGGALIAYEYASNTQIEARQRDYAAGRSPGLTLYPSLRHHSAALVAHQDIAPGLTFALDGLFNQRWADQTFPLNFAGDLSISRGRSFTIAQSFGLAPSVTLALPAEWQASLSGSYGRDRVTYGGELFFGTTRVDPGSGTYRNREQNVELSGNGRLLSLPGGTAKLAFGAGYRRTAFARVTGSVSQDIDRAQSSYYAFGELSLPLISSAQGIAFVNQLSLSAAVRYERYPGVGKVATPKLGLIYAPTPDFDIEASWGRSFRAATLYQQYQPRSVYLVGASSVGGSATVPGTTALLVVGGNTALKPERSSNWSATLDLHPRAIEGLKLELSYFSVDYADRIVTPIAFTSTALSDPANASFVARAPSGAAQAAIIAGGASFTDITGGAGYDPTRVIAIVDNSSVNAGRQRAHGIDALANYKTKLGANRLNLTLNASYLVSDQRIIATLPVTQLAGILYNPPHLRGRADLLWERGRFGLDTTVNFIGSVRDSRSTPAVHVAGMMPIDLTARYRGKDGKGIFGGIDITLSIQNVLNDKPTPIATSLFYDTPYDSTNYSPFGRVISLSVTKKW
ncbi:TonB-dependent receptor domain-containing protein [Sphingomonas sp. UYP23]